MPESFYERQARIKVQELLAPSDRPIVLIYQMGKVGSTSIYAALQKTAAAGRLVHVHYISDRVHRSIVRHRDHGVTPLPFHLFVGRELNQKLKCNMSCEVKVITMVRDPIATLVSGIFQTPLLFGLKDHEDMKENDLVTRLQEFVNEKDSYLGIFSWFDNEIKSVFGVDVHSISFNKNSGWGLYESNSLSVLMLQTEKMDYLPSEVMSDFVNCKVEMINRRNVRKKVTKNTSYQRIISRLSVSQGVLDFVYTSKSVQSFYSDGDIAEFRRKWQ